MHMSDVLIVPAVGAAMFACSGIAAQRSVNHLKKEADDAVIPMMGVLGAFVFASQMINFTIPGTGSSGHICGGFLLAAMLGPYAAFITMIGILTVQALVFADGGILALGCNIWNMAFYGCFIGGLLFWNPMMRKTVTKKRILAVSIFANIVSLQLGAFSVVLQSSISGITELPFAQFAVLMQPIHLVIGLIEGVLTGLVLMYVYETRPDRLYQPKAARTARIPQPSRMFEPACTAEFVDQAHTAGSADQARTFKPAHTANAADPARTPESANKAHMFKPARTAAVIFFAAAVVLGGALSLAASANPDGLEWAIGKTAAEELQGAGSAVHSFFDSIQQKTSFLPDYAFKNSESSAGTVFSGIAGVLFLTLAGIGAGKFLKRVHNRKHV